MNHIDVSKTERAVIVEALKVWLDPIAFLSQKQTSRPIFHLDSCRR